MTSPVDFISGPSIGSAPGNFIKGNTASLTEKYDGNEYFGYPMSLSFFPTMTSAAILARGMPVAFDTKGMVLEALGFTSSI